MLALQPMLTDLLNRILDALPPMQVASICCTLSVHVDWEQSRYNYDRFGEWCSTLHVYFSVTDRIMWDRYHHVPGLDRLFATAVGHDYATFKRP